MYRKHTDMRIEKRLLTFSGIFIGRKHVILHKQDKYAQQNARKFDIEHYSGETHLHYSNYKVPTDWFIFWFVLIPI